MGEPVTFGVAVGLGFIVGEADGFAVDPILKPVIISTSFLILELLLVFTDL